MEKKYMESKPGTFTPYYEAAEALKRKLAVLERVVPSGQDRAQLAMAIQVRNAHCNNPEALVVRTLSVLHLQSVPLTLDEAVFVLTSSWRTRSHRRPFRPCSRSWTSTRRPMRIR